LLHNSRPFAGLRPSSFGEAGSPFAPFSVQLDAG
jgi:hypothetical protein